MHLLSALISASESSALGPDDHYQSIRFYHRGPKRDRIRMHVDLLVGPPLSFAAKPDERLAGTSCASTTILAS